MTYRIGRLLRMLPTDWAKSLKTGLILVAALSLAACGGGGGGGGSSPSSTSSASSSSSSTSSSSDSSSSDSSLSSSVSSSSDSSSSSSTSSSSSSDSSSSSSTSSSSSSESSVPDTVMISGTVTYERVPTSFQGLDYASSMNLPVRGAVVNLINGADTLVATGTTDGAGFYELSAPANTSVKVQVEARSEQTGVPAWHLRVEDNTNGNALYVLEGALVSAGEADSTRDLHAASGWTGSGYTEPRAAAPFAILDVTYTMLEKLLAVDDSLILPLSRFRWSPLNYPDGEGQDVASGDIGTSHYFNSLMYILGDENVDTDEYDQHVIAHEWAHYLEDVLGHRLDSIGGPHGLTDKLDMRVAFSEGFANAIAAYVLDDPEYIDTGGVGQSQVYVGMDVSLGASVDPGWYSETSVQSILLQFAQTTDGFQAIYNTLTHDSYAELDAHVSVFAFADRLNELAPAQYPNFDALYSAEAIHSNDMFGLGETNDGDTPGVLPVYKSLADDGTATNVCSTQRNGGGVEGLGRNKLGAWVFLTVTPAVSGTYQLSVVKTSPSNLDTDPDFQVNQQGAFIADGLSFDVDSEVGNVSLTAGEVYVVSVREWGIATESVVSCFDVSLNRF